MRPIRLAQVRAEAPACEAFDDFEKVWAYEVAVRSHRALAEPFTVTPLDGKANGAFVVKGGRGTEYVVDIVDAGRRHDTCTCPDFLSNQLGVCKHVEAARRAVHQRAALRRELRRLDPEPGEPVITVDAARPTARLIAAGPWSPELRARWGGVLRPAPSEAARDLLALASSSGEVRVVHAAALALELLVTRARSARRQKGIDAAIAAGRLDAGSLGWPLFPYQREGVLHLVRRGRALLADDMGLGKTVQAIAACELLRRRGEVRRVLVVTTATLKHQWAQEIRRWAGEEAAVAGGASRARRQALTQDAAYTIVNYELAAERLDGLGIEYVKLHGGVPTERRPAILDRFRESPQVRVLLSTDAGGLGLNLQVASYVVHLDLPWNPARLDQRTGRAHRLGQTRGVLVTYLCAEQGIERGIEGVLHQKRAVREAVLDADTSVDAMAAPTFSVFVRQVQEVLEAVGEPAGASVPGAAAGDAAEAAGASGGGGMGVEEAVSMAVEEAVSMAVEEAVSMGVAGAIHMAVADGRGTDVAGAGSPAPSRRPAARADDRLRLARVVLNAGFPNDAARASYEAAAAALREVAGPGAPSDHAGLVAALYRDLLPSGRVPAGAHAVLARLHDLGALDSVGVELPAKVAEEALADAAALVAHLAGMNPERMQLECDP